MNEQNTKTVLADTPPWRISQPVALQEGQTQGSAGVTMGLPAAASERGGNCVEGQCSTVRQFDTGATRSPQAEKLCYDRFLSPLVLKRYAEYMREGTSGMSGHSHRGGCFYRTVRGGSYCWIEGGCACDLSPEYIQDDVANWQHGLGVATFENAGSQYHLQFVPIIKGKLLWGPHLVTWEG